MHIRLALLLLLACATSAQAQPVDVAPVPRLRRESIPKPPDSDRFAWQRGHWDWDAGEAQYIWRPGRYVVRPTYARRFELGRWTQTGGEWVWKRARWK